MPTIWHPLCVNPAQSEGTEKMPFVNREAFLRAIDWSKVEDEVDLKVWRRANTNQWLPEKVALSKDRRPWAELSYEQQQVTLRVFIGLTLLDTIQSQIGVRALVPHALTPHEDSVLSQFNYMESVHAQSYSSIFMTLTSSTIIAGTYDWSFSNEFLQKKGRLIEEAYNTNDPIKVRIASVFLESFVFYSGFYWPLYLLTKNTLTATASIIKLIIR